MKNSPNRKSFPNDSCLFGGNKMSFATLPEGDFSFLEPLKVTPVFSSYWRFACERQEIFLKRLAGVSRPWTDDPVLSEHRFTNSYRASDRVSQYLIRNVIYGEELSEDDTMFKILLFKIFNKIETWELLEHSFGGVRLSNFSVKAYSSVLGDAMNNGQRLYSAAYIMPSGGPKSPYSRKHEMHLNLLKMMLADDLSDLLVNAESMMRCFEILRGYPTIGDFLAYQYVTDLNYSDLIDFQESDFVVPGPGAKDGLRKCFTDFGGLNDAEVIKFITSKQKECFEAVECTFPSLWGRPLQPIDCQNLFCEIDKYARVAHPEIEGISGRTRIKQKLKPKTGQIEVFYPPKWNINHKLHLHPNDV